MNEVEKMYENAGVEKHYCSFESCDGNVYNWELNEDGEEKYNKCFLGKPKIKQRLFTAEKQLELIKWLAYKMHITIGKGLPWGQYDDDWWTVTSKKGYVGTNAYTLEEALANFVNTLWQDLTDAEKQQIKNILESEVRE